jgi:hypothetical protein
MKTLLSILLLIGVLTSCKRESDIEQFPQKWQLVKMYGQIFNSEVTGSEMEWQEFYLLKSDGSFTKSRQRNGVLNEASGTFSFKDYADGKYLELTYSSNNPIIGSCISDQKELLWVKSEILMQGTWTNCDGPGLIYERNK